MKESRQNPPAALRNMNDMERREFFACLSLKYCPKIGLRTAAKLLRRFKSAMAAVESRDLWREASVNEVCALEHAKEAWRAPAQKEWAEAAKSGAAILLWTSSLYPDRLREIADPPPFLYLKGDASLLSAPMIAVVGSRRASADGLKNAFRISSELAARGLTVVSGMALGVDRYAHMAAIDEIGKSAGVLGAGINFRYPAQNKDLYAKMEERGLLLSEFSPDQPPAGRNFPIRNRIISGLALGALVVEAQEGSGSLITANFALEQNREVYAIPGLMDSNACAGSMDLILQGALPVFSADDIIRDLSGLLKSENLSARRSRPAARKAAALSAAPPPLPESAPPFFEGGRKDAAESGPDFEGRELVEEKLSGDLSDKILICLRKGPMLAEDLALETGASLNEISSKLVFLELLGKIRRLPGALFEAL